MAYALSSSVRLDTETETDGGAVFNVFQVIGINLVCFFAFTGLAMMFGVIWWAAILIGWVGASVATLPVSAIMVLLWPVASSDMPARATVEEFDTAAHLRMWQEDLEAEHDAAFLSTRTPGQPEPLGWDTDIERKADALFRKAGDVYARGNAA